MTIICILEIYILLESTEKNALRQYCDLKKAVMEFKAWRSIQDIKIIIL